MRFAAPRILVMALAATAVFTTEAFAWGQNGHRIVCRIAFLLLDAPRQTEIRRLTQAFRKPDGASVPLFTEACLFADEARSKARDNVKGWNRFDPFDAWHFLNLPRSSETVDNAHCKGNCVLTGIAHHAAALAKATTRPARAEALFLLSHWVGDIHQPLHVSYADDRGGNRIQPINGGFYPSDHLHQVWDSGIVGKAIGVDGWRIYADRLAGRITPANKTEWLGTPEITWAQESYKITTAPKVEYCMWTDVQGQRTCVPIKKPRTLRAPYQAEFVDDIEMRLQQAGVRLAELIRQHLSMP